MIRNILILEVMCVYDRNSLASVQGAIENVTEEILQPRLKRKCQSDILM